MRTILIFGFIFLVPFIGCNSVQDELIHYEMELPPEHELQEHTDLSYKSYDDYVKVVRVYLLRQNYDRALKYILKMENDYPDRYILEGDLFVKCFVNLMLDRGQDTSEDLENFSKQFPSPETYFFASLFEMRMKNIHKAIEYLDKIELSETELAERHDDGFFYTMHMTKAAALLMLNEHEAGKKEYKMFLDVAKRFEHIVPLDCSTGYINLIDKAIEKPDEYFIIIADLPLPAPIPCPDDPEKVQIFVQYHLNLISKIDNTVVATCTVKL